MSLRNAFMSCAFAALAATAVGKFTDAEYDVVKLSEQVDDLCNRPAMSVVSAGGYALKVYPQGKRVIRECEDTRMRSTIAAMTGMPVWAIGSRTGEVR